MGLDPVTDAATVGMAGADVAVAEGADAAATAIVEADAEIASTLDEIEAGIENTTDAGDIAADGGGEEPPSSGGGDDGGNGGDRGNGDGNSGSDDGSDSNGGSDPARAQRLEELSKDPANGGKITPASQREAEVALQLEENGQLAGPIVRDPSGDAEFIDGEGTPWDVKQFHSEQGRFNLEKAVANINRELRAGENVILDTKFLDPNDATALRSAIEANGWQSQILWFLPE